MDESELVVLALTSRVVASSVPPLSSREFWRLARATDLTALVGRDSATIRDNLSVPTDHAERISRLLDRSAALALATEDQTNAGTWVVTGASGTYPRRLRERLGDAAPALLYGVGDRSLLDADGIGVVGSRDIGPDAAEVAREVARLASRVELPIVSGGARGIDQHAMNSAFEHGGQVVGILADSLERMVSRASTRQAIAAGRVCLATPYSPKAPFSAGNAMGRNKIIYALSRSVLVVRSDEATGGTWAGATEALAGRWSTVFSWTGRGSGPGNTALLEHGALELSLADELEQLLTAPRATVRKPPQAADQLSFF